VLAVNKMDLVGYDEAAFHRVVEDFRAFAGQLDLPDVTAIPIAALQGDNVVHRSEAMPWYDGPALLEHLEQVHVSREDAQARPARFPVQYVIRPMSTEHPDYRGYAGTLSSGTLGVGDEVVILPSGRRTTIEAIDTFDASLPQAVTGQAVTVRLSEQVDVSRGDMIVAAEGAPTVTGTFDATLCWMSDQPLVPGQRVLVKHTTRMVKAQVQTLHDRLDVTQLQAEPSDTLRLNDIGRVTVRTAQPLALDAYTDDRTTGAFIVLDEATGTTVGAGMVSSP
jgi:sulfate adenylyltransferase subunit 1 (EFTu-like GTPase family)